MKSYTMNPPSIIRLIKGTPKSGDPINIIEYNGDGNPSRVVYNVIGDTTEELLLTYSADNNIVVDGIEYKKHLLNIPSATLTINFAPDIIPEIVDILLDNTSIDETRPVDTVVGNLTVVGGTGPYGFLLTSGNTYFKIVGSELQVKQSIDNIPSPQTVIVTATDINQSSFSKPFSINIIDNPIITDISLDNDTVPTGSNNGYLVGQLTATGGTSPISFSIVNDPSNKFELDGNQLKLKAEVLFDEEPYTVSIRADDIKTRSFVESFEIQVDPEPYLSTTVTQFNGVDQFCFVDGSTSFNDPSFSLSLWVNFRGQSDQKGIMRKNTNFRIRKTNDLIFEIFGLNGTRKRGTVPASQFVLDDYFHIIMAYDANIDKMLIYINGELKSLTNETDDPFVNGRQTNNNDIELGQYVNGNFFSGIMDEVSYWSSGLNQEQATALYNNGEPNNIIGNPAADSLVSWWKMGEGDTAPTITDHIGSNDLTMVNMNQNNFTVRTPYVNTLSTSFNGIDESISCGDISITNNFSVFAWTKINDNPSLTIISKYSSALGERAFRFLFNSGQLRINISENGSALAKDALYVTSLNDGQWHFVGFTFENDDLKFYVDGSEVSIAFLRNDPVSSIHDSSFDFQIGQWGNGANPFVGNIDEITIWDTAVLTASDVEFLYNQGEPNDPVTLATNANLAHHYKMGEGSTAPVLIDDAGDNDGNMINMDQTNFVGDVP